MELCFVFHDRTICFFVFLFFCHLDDSFLMINLQLLSKGVFLIKLSEIQHINIAALN
jgi:hypothetical protein